MGKRKYREQFYCSHDGCKEQGFGEYETRAACDKYASKKWFCVRHMESNTVLSVDRPTIVFEVSSESRSSGIYWGGSRGFMHGPGFKAFAEDFPEGTILRITAEIIAPIDSPPARKETE